MFEVDLYSATLEELYEVPGIDEETARFIIKSRTSAETLEQFIALGPKHKAVFTENIEFSVGLLGRNKMKLTYRRQPINKYSCKILIKKKKKLERKAIKSANKKPRDDPKNYFEAQEIDPESTLTAEDDNDERTLTIDEDVNDETITADEDGDINEKVAAEEAFETQQQHQPQQSQPTSQLPLMGRERKGIKIVNSDIMEEGGMDNITRATATPVTTASTPAATASVAISTISTPASETENAPAPSSETLQPVKTSGIVTEGSDKVVALADGSDNKEGSPLAPSADKTHEPEVTHESSLSPSPPEMEATETQPHSDMETRTFPQMAEVQTENEEETTSPPDPADKETGIHTEDDDARITGDVLVPDSIQSVSEEELGADHIPGETVMPVTDVFPEDAINAETVAGTILQRIKNSKKSPKQCKKSPKQGKKSPKQGEEKEALALYQFKKFKAVSNSSSRVIVKALLKELILLLPIGVVAAMDQCDRNMVAENKSNPNQFEGFWALVNICNEMKEMSCKLCIKVVNAAVLLPCCAAAACDECARNMLVENELKCSLCEETDISPDDLIPNPMLRKKVAAFKNKGKEENRIQLVPAEIMLQKEEEKRIIEEQRKAAVSNIGDQEAPSDNAPVSVSPSEMEEKSDNVPWLSLPPILSPLSDSGDEDEDIWAVCYDILEDIMISTSERMVEAPNKKKRRI